MMFSRLLVAFGAAVFLLYGLACLLFPEAVAQWATGEAPSTPSGLIDMRATYGGMSVGIGALLALLASNPLWTKPGLIGLLLLMLGMGGARGYGMLLDGAANQTMWAYFIIEAVAAALTAWLLLRNRHG